jgi:hypothetical protein
MTAATERALLRIAEQVAGAYEGEQSSNSIRWMGIPHEVGQAARAAVKAASAAEADLQGRLSSARQNVIRLGGQLHLAAMGAVGNAETAIAEFDRQSEGALADANAVTEKARAALLEAGAVSGPRQAELEQRVHEALAGELKILRSRAQERALLEARWTLLASAACQSGLAMLQADECEPVYMVRSLSARDVVKAIKGGSLHEDGRGSSNGATS